MNKEPVNENESTETAEADDAVIGQAFRWSLVVIVILAGCVGGGVWWFNRETPAPPVKNGHVTPPKFRDKPKLEIPEIRFTDITSEAGITFVHHNGAYGEKMLPETMGGGCAFFDFDNDGDQDLLLINSCEWPWSERDLAALPITQLYRNDGTGRFENVSKGSGLDVTMYGMGVAVGDFDNDGLVDVFISAVGKNRLFHNDREGKFTDVTDRAAVAGSDDQWSTSTGFFDYDNDGDLDLFVCNYVKWSREIDLAQGFSLTGIGRAYGPPTAFEGTHPYLYQNNGDGTFTDVSAKAGVQVSNPTTGVPMAKSMGVTMVDLDGDGLLDVIVSNDTVRNYVFRNQGDGTFEELGIDAGLAFDSAGKARAGMGIDAANYRNTKAMGVAIGNFANEMTAFYVADNKPMRFTDDAVSTGL